MDTCSLSVASENALAFILPVGGALLRTACRTGTTPAQTIIAMPVPSDSLKLGVQLEQVKLSDQVCESVK